jgi:DHA3 family macrolide efflux protein-like MFS transporter
LKSFKKLFGSSLGPDFWKFRLGQLVSLLGNGCRSIALSWWILEKTGSAKAIASVLVPAMAVSLVLLPLFGPLGDNFSRKKLMVIGDLGRFVTGCLMAGMVHFDFFNLPLLACLYSTAAIGTALFNAAEYAIMPQIVVRGKLQAAFQQTYALSSFGGVAGGIVGGLVVSVFGILGGFLTDAASFLIAGLSTNLIQANTVPRRKRKASPLKSMSHLKRELFDGFRLLFKIPVLFWTSMMAMLINFVQAPFWVALPLFVKLSKGMPAWYMGGLESSLALGTIVGALSLKPIQKVLKNGALLMATLALQGAGFLFLPLVPGLLLPLGMLLGVGLGSSIANIRFDTQLALVIPDSHRSRFNSIIEFLCLGLYPVGMAGGSLVIAQVGVTTTLGIMGLLLILMAPLILLIPKLSEFLEVPAHRAGGFLKKHYPGIVV